MPLQHTGAEDASQPPASANRLVHCMGICCFQFRILMWFRKNILQAGNILSGILQDALFFF